uniref:Uncharacterized protein n=1 Tax=Anopheles maculatus TaxID=74869 RepID=A0A182T5V6_9DIPT
DFVLDLWKGHNLERLTEAADTCCSDVTALYDMMKGAIETYTASSDYLWHWKKTHELVNGCIEMISLMVFVLAVCYDKYLHSPASQTQPNTGKKGKKGQSSDGGGPGAANNATAGDATAAPILVPERERLVLVTKVLRELKQRINEMDLVLLEWGSPLNDEIVSSSIVQILNDPKEILAGFLPLTISENAMVEVAEMRKLLKDKLKLMSKAI